MKRLAVAAALALAASAPAHAHEVRHEIVRGRAVALRATFADGEPLAYAEYQVFAPSDPRIPFQKGRTDRAGWLAFVPSEPGTWRVKVVDASGHGLDVEVPAAGGEPAAPASKLAPVLRPLAGVAAVGAVFGLLMLFHRLRRRS